MHADYNVLLLIVECAWYRYKTIRVHDGRCKTVVKKSVAIKSVMLAQCGRMNVSHTLSSPWPVFDSRL